MLFDAKGRAAPPTPLEVKEGDVTSVAFGPGGTIAAGYESRPRSSAAWCSSTPIPPPGVRKAGQVANRNFTRRGVDGVLPRDPLPPHDPIPTLAARPTRGRTEASRGLGERASRGERRVMTQTFRTPQSRRWRHRGSLRCDGPGGDPEGHVTKGRRAFRLDLIKGTSTGGIIAIGLAMGGMKRGRDETGTG